MPNWLPKSIKASLIAAPLGYVGFNIYCVVGYAVSKPPTEPVPSLIWGIPVAVVIAGIAFIFSAVRNSN
jgi:cytochrome c-type biogenesis protein CcmH/NrfF